MSAELRFPPALRDAGREWAHPFGPLVAAAGGIWLDGVIRRDLTSSRGNGPFGPHGPFLGVVLHVNAAPPPGTSDAYFAGSSTVNPDSVTPNFQVLTTGEIHQYLPLDWQPWCQITGNYQYAAIETGGEPSTPLTDAQVASVVRILQAYKQHMGLELVEANKPGEKGLGTHQMGGAAWGGHPCPGTIRANQRTHILALARGEELPVDQATFDKLMTGWANSPDGQAALEKAARSGNPMPDFNVGEDGKRHSLHGFLARIPGYKPFPKAD